MNSKIFLIYTFKKISFKGPNYIKIKNQMKFKSNNGLITKNNYLALLKYQRYALNFLNNKLPFLVFGLMWFIGNKTGRYISEKFIFKKQDAKLFIISDLL